MHVNFALSAKAILYMTNYETSFDFLEGNTASCQKY